MKCRRVRSRLLHYIGEPLPPLLENHITNCPECKEYYEGLQRSRKILKELPTRLPPPDLEDNILRRLKDMKEKEGQSKSWFRTTWQIKPAFAILSVFLLVLLLAGANIIFVAQKPDNYDMKADGLMMRGTPMLYGVAQEAMTMNTIEAKANNAGGEFSNSIDRKIIYTANLELEVPSPDEAQEYALNYVQGKGGFVSETRRSIGSREQIQVRMVLRIPVNGFDAALLDFLKMGKVIEQGVQGRDITEEYYDIEARLQTKLKQEERYLEILTSARTVEEVVKVERELERIRGDIESMEGTLRYYKDRTDLSTITLLFKEPVKISVGGFTLKDIIKEISEAFLRSFKSLLLFIGSFLPWLVVLGIIVFIVSIFVKRRR